MYGESLTPTQRAAHERSRAFRNRIETLALKLKVGLEAPVPKEVIQAEPEPPQAPAPTPWFSIIHEIEPTLRAYPSYITIQNAVCAHYNVKRADMISHRRTMDVTFPRQVAMFLCKDLTPMSFPAIGKRFGGRDHSTAIHAHRKIERLVSADADFAETINTIRGSLTA